jgi:hypothetical protein
MKETYVSNAFSLSMLPNGADLVVRVVEPSDVAPALWDGFTSAMGHADIAALAAASLQWRPRDLPVNRVNLTLKIGDVLFVAQYLGPRLPEGATELPEGSRLEWRRVEVVPSPAEQIAAGLARANEDLSHLRREVERWRNHAEYLQSRLPVGGPDRSPESMQQSGRCDVQPHPGHFSDDAIGL